MKIEKLLQFEKNKYLMNNPSEDFMQNGWKQVREKLPEIKKEIHFFDKNLARLFAVLILLVTSLFGLIQVAQGALPGEPLYAVKRFSENIASVVSKPQVKAENRAKEIVDLANKKRDSEIKKTVEEYRENIRSEKENLKSDNERKDLRERLEKQEEEFKKAIEQNSSSREEINKAIEANREGRDEVKTENKIDNKEVKGEKVFRKEEGKND